MTRFPNSRDETTGILHRGHPTEKTGETVTVPIGNIVMEKGCALAVTRHFRPRFRMEKRNRRLPVADRLPFLR